MDSKGYTLTEVLIGVALTAVLGTAVAATLKVQAAGIRNNRITATRDGLQALATRYVQDRTALQKSAKYRGANSAGNTALDFCLNGPPPAPTVECSASVFPNCCQATAANSSQPFILLDPADPAWTRAFSGTVAAASPLAITTDSPQRYDLDLKACPAASEMCRYELVTSFVSACPGSKSRCSLASQIDVQFGLRQADSISQAGTGAPPLRNLSSGPINVQGGAGKMVGMATFSSSPSGLLTPGQPAGWLPFPAASSTTTMGLSFTVSDPSEVFLLLGRGRLAAAGIATAVGFQVTDTASYDPAHVVDGGHWGTASVDLNQNNGCDPANPIYCRQFFASGWSYFTGHPPGTYTLWLMGYDGRAGDRLYTYDRQLLIYQLR